MTKQKEIRSTYHHGNLRRAVIDATLCLVDEGGFDNVNLREVARRAGVSTGAPFRHFPNKTALLTAVAEEAMQLFRAEIASELKKLTDPTPIARFRAIGGAYLRWAIRHSTHFQILSAQSQIDFDGSESLREDSKAVRALMDGVPPKLQFGGRAMVYGLARMYVAGNFAQWGLSKTSAKQALIEMLDTFMAGLSQDLNPSGSNDPQRKTSLGTVASRTGKVRRTASAR
jgi:AcrR family transcriptional regulator